MNGTVKTVESKKKYGFIRAEDGKDYFFHEDDFLGFWQDLVVDYQNGSSIIRVEFVADNTPKGLRASSVNRLDWPNQANG